MIKYIDKIIGKKTKKGEEKYLFKGEKKNEKDKKTVIKRKSKFIISFDITKVGLKDEKKFKNIWK